MTPLALLDESSFALDGTTTAVALVLIIAWVFWHGTWLQKLGKQVETLNDRIEQLERKRND